MKVYQENRKKIILKNFLVFFIMSIILFPILNIYFPVNKSHIELIILFIFSGIGLILNTRKIKLEFDDQNKVLMIFDSHILGGGKKYLIPYDDLRFKLKNKNLLTHMFNKPELTILKNSSKVSEIRNLNKINDTYELIDLIKKFG